MITYTYLYLPIYTSDLVQCQIIYYVHHLEILILVFFFSMHLSNTSSLVQVQLRFWAWVIGLPIFVFFIFQFNDYITHKFQRFNYLHTIHSDNWNPFFVRCTTVVRYNSYIKFDIVILWCKIRKLIFFQELVSNRCGP